jgi:hypothetical protein
LRGYEAVAGFDEMRRVTDDPAPERRLIHALMSNENERRGRRGRK